MVLVPALFFFVLEMGLRVFGYGNPPDFFVWLPGRDAYTTNPRFGWRFFPPAIARTPVPCEMRAEKPAGTYRIFVLGSSAAMGTPEPAFSFGRMLQVMLHERWPDRQFEVINAAMTAVNSHVVLPIARQCAEHNPDLFVVYMGNNEFIGPFGAGTVFQGYCPSLRLIRASIYFRGTRTGQLLDDVIGRWSQRDSELREWQGMEAFVAQRVPPDDPRAEKVYGHFRANLAAICDAARGSGARVVLCTVATNLSDCAPFAAVHRDDLTEDEQVKWEALYQAGVALAEAGDHAKAAEALLAAAEIDDRFADLHYRLGKGDIHLLCEAPGTDRRLVGPFRQKVDVPFSIARDLDALRFRADTRINAIVREVAGEKDEQGIFLVDAERAFAESSRSAHQVPGDEWFYEHVHLNPEGNHLLAEVVFRKVAALLSEGESGADLPGAQARAEPAAAGASLERCCELLSLTGWDRYRMELAMSQMQDRPPFTAQCDYAGRRAARQKRLEQLEERGGRRAALDDAYRRYSAAVARAPEDLRIRENFAKLSEERGDYAAAAEQLRTLLERLPDVVEWRSSLSVVLQRQHKPEEAIAELHEVMRLNPAHAATSHFSIGAVLFEEGNVTAAAEQFRQALAIHPKMAKALNSLGSCLYQEEKTDEAIEHFRQALELDPSQVKPRQNLGLAYLKQGDFAEAAEQYEESIRLDPKDLDGYRGLARVLVKQGKRAHVVNLYRRMVRAAPRSAQAHFLLGSILEAQARVPEAVEQYEAALLIDPGNVEAGHNLGSALARLGRPADAIRQYRRVLEHNPDSIPTLNNLARMLASSERLQCRDGAEAVQVARRACELGGHKEPRLLDTLAAAYAEAGQFQDALATVRKALQLAQEQGKRDFAAVLEQRLLLYENHLPLRER